MFAAHVLLEERDQTSLAHLAQATRIEVTIEHGQGHHGVERRQRVFQPWVCPADKAL